MKYIQRCTKIFSFTIKQQRRFEKEHRLIFCSEMMSPPEVLRKPQRPTGVVVPLNIFKVEPAEGNIH